MAAACATSINFTRMAGGTAQEASVCLTTPKGWKKPPGFPRGRLATVNPHTEVRVWHFKAFNVLAWLVAKELVVLAPGEGDDVKVTP